MDLNTIGFYSLSDSRAKRLNRLEGRAPMSRCELILTDKCNFNCPYCRGLRADLQGTLSYADASQTLRTWVNDGLENIRFSGGEPTLYPWLDQLVVEAEPCAHIAISTNGSAPLDRYKHLIDLGVNDFSISLDTCCAAKSETMTGCKDQFEPVTSNIRALSLLTYVTLGVVLTEENLPDLRSTIEFAYDLGVSDVRIIPAAQHGTMIRGVKLIDQRYLDEFPILKYRVENLLRGVPVRSINETDSHRCYFPIDDSVVAGNYHFPCVIYMREKGDAIGRVGPGMKEARLEWSKAHNTFLDPICKANCLDVCVAHNNKCRDCSRSDQRPTDVQSKAPESPSEASKVQTTSGVTVGHIRDRDKDRVKVLSVREMAGDLLNSVDKSILDEFQLLELNSPMEGKVIRSVRLRPHELIIVFEDLTYIVCISEPDCQSGRVLSTQDLEILRLLNVNQQAKLDYAKGKFEKALKLEEASERASKPHWTTP